MPLPGSRFVAAVVAALALISSSRAQVAPHSDAPPSSLADRVGLDDGFGLIVTASADGKGSLEMCGCGRQPLGGLARRVGYENAVVELTKGQAGLLRLDAGGAFDDTVDTGKNEVIPHIRNEWVLRGYLSTDVAAINVSVSDLRYLSPMNVSEDRPARLARFPMLGRIVSANVVPVRPGIVPFLPYIVHEVPAPRAGDRPVRVGIVGVSAAGAGSEAGAFGYKVEDPIVALSALLPEVRKKADLVVLLAYAPAESARSIASAVSGLDIVFVANNFFPDAETFSNSGNVPVAPVVLQSRMLTEVRGWRSPSGSWRFAPRSVLLDGNIPSDTPTLEMVYRARADIIR